MNRGFINEQIWLGILVSVLCGFIIGLERQIRGKPVGIRTSILICLGSMLFIFLGGSVQEGNEIARVLGQLVTGIGFLGAGAIMTRGDAVTGMTSAAVVWLLAGIGACIGLQYYSVAIVITFVVIGVLIGVEKLEKIYKVLRKGLHSNKSIK